MSLIDGWASEIVRSGVEQGKTTGEIGALIDEMYDRLQIPASVRDVAKAQLFMIDHPRSGS